MAELNPEIFKSYSKRCWIIFAAVAMATLVMVSASYAPLPNRAAVIGVVLAIAAFNAFMVAGYLMHLLTEKRTIYAMLAFTGLFFIALMLLTWWAAGDKPALL